MAPGRVVFLLFLDRAAEAAVGCSRSVVSSLISAGHPRPRRNLERCGVAPVLRPASERGPVDGTLRRHGAALGGSNVYFLMRAGQGGSDKRGLIQSHPVDKLHVDNGLTDQGISEAIKAASVLRNLGVDNAFIWADISSRAQETARILAQELGIRQERVVPEYAFLEPRGMGIYDGKDAAAVLPEVYKMDAQDLLWSPPPNTDGTPNESVNQVFSRVRQLMSKLETLYQGEDVVIVSPDSDCLSILQAFVLGESLGTHSRHYLGPGEGHPLLVSPNTEYLYDTRRAGSGNPELGGDMAGIEVAAAPSGVRGGTT